MAGWIRLLATAASEVTKMTRPGYRTRFRILPLLFAAIVANPLLAGPGAATSSQKFERVYPRGRGPAHLTISNTRGDIIVDATNRKSISVRAFTVHPSSVVDVVRGNEIEISVKKRIPPSRTDFKVQMPRETSISLMNVVGRIEITGAEGDVTVESFDSDVELIDTRARLVDVKITRGNITFDGELTEGGSYSLQSVKGDIDVTLPASSPFNLNARSLTGAINLGDFLSRLSGGSKVSKGITGTHLKGGPNLTLTTFSGRVLLHTR